LFCDCKNEILNPRRYVFMLPWQQRVNPSETFERVHLQQHENKSTGSTFKPTVDY